MGRSLFGWTDSVMMNPLVLMQLFSIPSVNYYRKWYCAVMMGKASMPE